MENKYISREQEDYEINRFKLRHETWKRISDQRIEKANVQKTDLHLSGVIT